MSGIFNVPEHFVSTAHKCVCRQDLSLKDFWSSDVNKELFKKKVDTVEKSGKLKIEATNPEYKRAC